MQMLLLQMVEELTLTVIEQQKALGVVRAERCDRQRP
jgi:hypothetical protein